MMVLHETLALMVEYTDSFFPILDLVFALLHIILTLSLLLLLFSLASHLFTKVVPWICLELTYSIDAYFSQKWIGYILLFGANCLIGSFFYDTTEFYLRAKISAAAAEAPVLGAAAPDAAEADAPVLGAAAPDAAAAEAPVLGVAAPDAVAAEAPVQGAAAPDAAAAVGATATSAAAVNTTATEAPTPAPEAPTSSSDPVAAEELEVVFGRQLLQGPRRRNRLPSSGCWSRSGGR